MVCKNLPNENIQQILKHLKRKDLFSLLLVNRHWCCNVVKCLYANPFYRSKYLIIRTYISCLDETELQCLSQQIKLPTLSKPLFDYVIFLKELNYKSLNNRVYEWIHQNHCTKDNKNERIAELFTILLKLIMRSGINLKSFKFTREPNKLTYRKFENPLFIPDVKEVFTIQPGLSNITKFEGHMTALYYRIDHKIFQVFQLIPSICENIEILNLSYSSSLLNKEPIIDDTIDSLIPNIIKSQKRLLEFTLTSNSPIKFFEQLKKHENSLKNLSLNMQYKEVTTTRERLPRFKILENLSLSCCKEINLEQLKILFGNNSNLIKQLELFSWPDQLQSELFRIIGSSLQSLTLNNVSTKIIESVLKNCPNITEFIIFINNKRISLIISLISRYSLKYLTFHTNVYVYDSDLENLGKNLPHTLECLILKLDYKGLNSAKFLENCKANLKVLILKEFNHLGLDAIIKYVEERRSLKILGISEKIYKERPKEYNLLEERYNVKIIYQNDDLIEWSKWY